MYRLILRQICIVLAAVVICPISGIAPPVSADTGGAGNGTAFVYDFDYDISGSLPQGWNFVQTSGGTVRVMQEADGSKFVRMQCDPKGSADTNGYMNLTDFKAGKRFFFAFDVSTPDNLGTKTVLIRDNTNTQFIILARFTGNRLLSYPDTPFEVSRGYVPGEKYNMLFDVDIEGGTIKGLINGEAFINAPIPEGFDFGNITFRFQNRYKDGYEISRMDVDNVVVQPKDNADDGELSVASVSLHNDNGVVSGKIDTHTAIASAVILNTGNKTKNLRFLAAAYKDGRLTDLKAHPVSIEHGIGNYKFIKERIECPADASELKLFLWDFEKLTPLAKSDIQKEKSRYIAPTKQMVLDDFERVGSAKERPWLLTDKNRFVMIAATIDADFVAWKSSVLVSAQSMLSAKPYGYNVQNGSLLSVARNTLHRIRTLAIAYIITKNPQFAERVYQELESAAGFPDWNPSHFLDTAEMTTAFAIGYDWLYGYWEPGRLELIRNAIINKGLNPGIQSLNRQFGSSYWFDKDTNWNAVCNSGLAVGAIAVMDTHPEFAAEIISKGLLSLNAAIPRYAPDGGWHEGPNYWSYATRYLVNLISTMENVLGTHYGYFNAEGLERTGYFPIYLNGAKNVFNLSDSGDGLVDDPILFWLGSKLSDKDLVTYRYKMLKSGYFTPSAYDLIWYEPALAENEITLPLSGMFRDCEVATFRSGWDANASFAGLHGGYNNATHGDLDAGTFVLDMQGERFAMDLGPDDYDLPSYFDTAGMRRWRYYRKRAEGNNTIVINPGSEADQTAQSVSPVVKYRGDGANPFAVVDTTAAYGGEALSAKRGVMRYGDSFVLKDEIILSRSSEAYWFMHTKAAVDIAADKKSAILTVNNKRVWVGIIEGDGEFYRADARPLPTSPDPPGQDVNAGISKLSMHFENISQLSLAVAFIPLLPGQNSPPQVMTVYPISTWE